jgi:hypothetical protein
LIADRPEPLLHHHFRKADDCIERRADFVADLRQEIGLLRVRGFRRPPRRHKFFLRVLPMRDVAENGAELVRPSEAPHRHEQRDEPSLRHPADHFASVIEDAGYTVGGKAVEIVERRLSALLGEEICERLAQNVARLDPEKRLRAPVEIADPPASVDDDHTVGRRVENGLELAEPGFDRRDLPEDTLR